MPNPRLVAQMQREGIEEALDIAERLGYGEQEHFGHVRHPATNDVLKAGVVAGTLAKAVEDLSKRVEELEAKSSKKVGASSKERSKKSA